MEFDAPATIAEMTTSRKRSRTWISDLAKSIHGRGREICEALGVDDVSAALSKRKFRLPGTDVPKAKINDPERGCGQCDKTDQKWKDWIGFAQVVRGDNYPREAAEFLANVLDCEISKGAARARRSPSKTTKAVKDAGGKVTLPKSLKIMPWNTTLVGLFLKSHVVGDAKKASKGLQDAGLQIAELRHKVACDPDRWESVKVLVFPVWGDRGSEPGPVNWIVQRLDGQNLYAWTPEGKPDPGNPRPKRKTIGGRRRGLIGDVRQVDALIADTLPAGIAIKTEGVSDWMTAILRDDLPPGAMVWTNPFGCRDIRQTWEKDRWSFDMFRGRELWVIHDADKPGQAGAVGELREDGTRTAGWCQRFAEAGVNCKNVTLPFRMEHSHGRDLQNFFCGGGTFSILIERAKEAAMVEPIELSSQADPTRDTIRWGDNEKLLVEASICSLAKSPNVFQRGGELYDVVETLHPLNSDESVLRVRRLPLPHLRTELSSRAVFIATSKSEAEYAKTITNTLVQQIDRFGDYPGVRELWSVAEFPFLRPDGSICSESGYDSSTKTFLKTGLNVNVPDRPSKEDAAEAAKRLLDLVSDFEFQTDAHRSSWLAGLLTVFAKPAIRGCCPLFIIEASTQGAGKTRLVDLISIIATGRTMTRNSWPSRDEEVAKCITAIVASGIPTVLFDNCKTILGGQAIEALGTSESWKGRILGESRETPEMPVRQVFFFTGNNCGLTSDVARRGCFTRLEPSVENPDLRDDFTHADLLGHALKNRESLVSDALVILRAFHLSGEQPSIQRWGGFEAWSQLIRGAIVWLGLNDPIQATVDAKKDTVASDVFPELLEGLQEAGLSDGAPATAAEILSLSQTQNGYGEFVHKQLRDSLLSACGEKKCTTQRIGMILKRYDGRILGGQKFSSTRNSKNSTSWQISSIQPRNPGTFGTSGGQCENRSTGSEAGVSKTNIEGTPGSSESSGVPARCSPGCSESDRIETTDASGTKLVCGRCGRFYGRKK